jgi:hypothetical protein
MRTEFVHRDIKPDDIYGAIDCMKTIVHVSRFQAVLDFSIISAHTALFEPLRQESMGRQWFTMSWEFVTEIRMMVE